MCAGYFRCSISLSINVKGEFLSVLKKIFPTRPISSCKSTGSTEHVLQSKLPVSIGVHFSRPQIKVGKKSQMLQGTLRFVARILIASLSSLFVEIEKIHLLERSKTERNVNISAKDETESRFTNQNLSVSIALPEKCLKNSKPLCFARAKINLL